MLIPAAVSITDSEVVHVAKLARLELTDEEVVSLAGDLNAILGYVEKLSELDTEAVEPTSQIVAVAGSMREDTVTNPSLPEDAIANAPASEDRFFVVPSIIE